MRNKILIIIAVLMLPLSSYANCESYRIQARAIMDVVRKEQTGGTVESLRVASPSVQNAKRFFQQAIDAGCPNLGADFQAPGFMAGDNTNIRSENAPAAPGDSSIASEVYKDSLPEKQQKNGASSFPAMKEQDASTNTKVVAGGGAAKGNTNKPATGTAAASTCGNVANEYGKYISGLSGAETPTYKAGCAGTNNDNTARTSPDGTGAVCTGNQFGQFGLVQAAYNNSAQITNVSNLASATPASTGDNVVASSNNATGAKNEPNGCRLSNYSTCGQVGDVIMVQSKATATASDPYDAYLIYAGSNQFYQVQSGGGKAVVKSTLPPQYAGATYAAVRPTCGMSTASN